MEEYPQTDDPLRALNEMHRVIKPKGTLIIMDLNGEASLKAVKAVAESMGIRGIMAYLAGAIQRSAAYSRKEFEAFFAQSEFSDFQIEDSFPGFSISLRK